MPSSQIRKAEQRLSTHSQKKKLISYFLVYVVKKSPTKFLQGDCLIVIHIAIKRQQ